MSSFHAAQIRAASFMFGGAAPTLESCLLIGSTARAGGAWASDGASGSVQTSRIEGNSAISVGAGFFLDSSPILLQNNLIMNNVSLDDGGGVWIDGSSPQLTFNTISGNSGVDGAGVFMRFGAPRLTNNIIAENIGDGIYFQIVPSSVIRYNCVADNDSGNFVMFANNPSQGPAGIGVLDSVNANGDPCDRYRNIVLSPLWVTGTGSNYYLSNTSAGNPVNSPCINAGDSLVAAPIGTTRVDFVGDSGIPDQGYHAPQLAPPPPPVTNLVIQADTDSVKLNWSYDGLGLFRVKADSSSTGSFLSTVAVTTDTTVTLPYTAPIHPTKGFFEVTVEPLP
ncbi:MAG: right-handed parallel beta-helix repeat-containing protein [bacterium]|nr:right-handed parallel beta-helix repeat-containing protein [bacterium]